MNRGSPYSQGLPVKPFTSLSVDAGSDCWLPLQFLDRSNSPATPVTISYRVDNITDNINILGDTSVAPNGSTIELNFPGSLNVMSQQYRSSQINQVLVTSTYADGSVRKKPFFYEIINLCTVGGA